MQSITVTVPNGNIHILKTDAVNNGSESKLLPVVFIHGMACSTDIWTTQLVTIAQTRPAIAIDLRGHGASTPPTDGDYSPTSCATDLLTVLETLGLDQIALVGHSYGSCVALAAAAAKPNHIAQLILVDPPIDCTQCPPEVYKAQIAPMQAALAGDDWRSVLESSFRNALTGSTPATHDYILARLAATPKDRLIGTGRELFTFPAVTALDQYLSSPKSKAHVILAPSNNLPFSLHILRPTLSTITLPGTGHWLMLDAPEEFAAALHTCLSTA